MTPILITGPAVEPLVLDEAKAWAKVDNTADDGLIGALIISARISIEQATRLQLITQSWRLIADRWPRRNGADWGARAVDLPLSPVQSVTAITLFDQYDVPTLIDPASYRLDRSRINPRLIFSTLPPAPQRIFQGISIDIVVGFGALATDVPEPLRQAMRLLVAYCYANRGDVNAPLPAAVEALISPFRRLKVSA
jgi:uncharacterized phiE125 gp8 family phage protein